MSLSGAAERSLGYYPPIVTHPDVAPTSASLSVRLTESLCDQLESDFIQGSAESLPPQTLSRPPERMSVTRIEHKVWANAQRTEMKTVWTEEVESHDVVMATLRHRKLLNMVVRPDVQSTGVFERIKRGFRAYQANPFWTK
jgi:hypothetical protein